MKLNTRTLLLDLPGCPAGRLFKQAVNGSWFHSMSDDEAIHGNFHNYVFTDKEIENNPKWFGTIFKTTIAQHR